MKLTRALQRIEIKRAMRVLPQYYLGAIVLALLIGVVAVCGVVATRSNSEKTTIRVAFVMNSNKYLSTLGMQILTTAKSTDGFCEFESVDEETAMQGLKDYYYKGVVIFPDHFVSSVTSEDDAQAQIFMPQFGNSFNDYIFKGLAMAGSNLLVSTEASFTAVAKFCELRGTDKETTKLMDDEINVLLAEHALSRESIFIEDTASGTGNLSGVQYYVCAAIVMLLLLGGISCGPFLKGDRKAYSDQLAHHQIGPVRQLLTKYVAVLCLFATLYVTIFLLFSAWYLVKRDLFVSLLGVESFSGLCLWFAMGSILIFLAAAIVVFVYTFAINQIGGIMLLFLVSVLMGYASGCLTPSAFLPIAVKKVAHVLPTTLMFDTVLNGIRLSFDWANTGWLLLQAFGWLGAACLITKGRKVLGR